MKDYGYTKEEKDFLKKLNSPAKIQDYLNSIPFNFEKNGDTFMSPRRVVRDGTAHCMEGAMFAAAALEFHGYKPLVLDLRSVKKPFDYDHVLAVWKQDGHWGAISKTNHGVLRYREPVYKTIRELVMSFFHEYFLHSGEKTLREYSVPLNLNRFNKIEWRTSEEELWDIPGELDSIKHHSILSKKQIKNLRLADKIEIEIGKIVEFKK
ncbi:MAG: hypothetical protein V4690_03780 [Patescibacteria group bacterium]